jgi:hypothetical protein
LKTNERHHENAFYEVYEDDDEDEGKIVSVSISIALFIIYYASSFDDYHVVVVVVHFFPLFHPKTLKKSLSFVHTTK